MFLFVTSTMGKKFLINFDKVDCISVNDKGRVVISFAGSEEFLEVEESLGWIHNLLEQNSKRCNYEQ